MFDASSQNEVMKDWAKDLVMSVGKTENRDGVKCQSWVNGVSAEFFPQIENNTAHHEVVNPVDEYGTPFIKVCNLPGETEK